MERRRDPRLRADMASRQWQHDRRPALRGFLDVRIADVGRLGWRVITRFRWCFRDRLGPVAANLNPNVIAAAGCDDSERLVARKVRVRELVLDRAVLLERLTRRCRKQIVSIPFKASSVSARDAIAVCLLVLHIWPLAAMEHERVSVGAAMAVSSEGTSGTGATESTYLPDFGRMDHYFIVNTTPCCIGRKSRSCHTKAERLDLPADFVEAHFVHRRCRRNLALFRIFEHKSRPPGFSERLIDSSVAIGSANS